MLLVAQGSVFSGSVHYVWLDSPDPQWPYTNWATAAHVVQDAVDAAEPGDEVVVTNGLYATGGKAVYRTMTNRVAVDKPLMLRSVNGPAFTIIQGQQVPTTVTGPGAIRCLYLANGATVSGFTLTGGATPDYGDSRREQSGGGVWCQSSTAWISNCVLTGNSACSTGGAAYWGTLQGCTISSNSAALGGGGATESTLDACVLLGNSARQGGGAYRSELRHCSLEGNSAEYGGGVFGGMLSNCALRANTASSRGGGGYGNQDFPVTLHNSTLIGNTAQRGGGTDSATLNNCALTRNSALQGGGVFRGTLYNCTLTGNSAMEGGGAYGRSLGPDGWVERLAQQLHRVQQCGQPGWFQLSRLHSQLLLHSAPPLIRRGQRRRQSPTRKPFSPERRLALSPSGSRRILGRNGYRW